MQSNSLLRWAIALLGIGLFIAAATYGETALIHGQLALCDTSGCSRSYGFGTIFAMGLMPIISFLYLSTLTILLKLGFTFFIPKHPQPKFIKLLLISAGTFSLTSIIFIISTASIFEPGYASDLRAFIYMLLKMVLLVLNAIFLFFLVRFLGKTSWIKTLLVALLPLVLFGTTFYHYYSDAKPYFYYLNEERTYILAKYYLVDLPRYRAKCKADPQWCLQDWIKRREEYRERLKQGRE